MITEDYVSFETAKLLKRKGFNDSMKTFEELERKHRDELDYKIKESAHVHAEINRAINAFLEFLENDVTELTIQDWLKTQFLRFYNLGKRIK